MTKFETLPDVKALCERGGVREDDYAIHTAVVHHGLPKELERANSPWRLTSLLKDAGALDRVRPGDLDPRDLRNSEARGTVWFVEALFVETYRIVPTGDDHPKELWPEALRILQRRVI